MSRGGELNLGARAWLRVGCRRLPPIATTAPRRPVVRARVALVSTGGAHLPGQEPFDTGKLGDPSFRRIPRDTEPDGLRWVHPHYDTTIPREDVDAVFPLPLLRRLEAEGAIGSLAPTAYSMMGYIPLVGRLIRETAPAIGELMQGEAVDAALLCPA
ncbi:MAG: glycine/sarcosine/betaine reductase selenoprotein B family protein [Gemmatimonadota bacterium]